jgi:hypothetical protein
MLKLNQQTSAYHAAIVLSNLGSRDLRLGCALNSDAGLIRDFQQAALRLQQKLVVSDRPLLSDQVPFTQSGIAAIALLNPDSPSLITADDSPERVSAEALAKAGQLVLYYLCSQQTLAHE